MKSLKKQDIDKVLGEVFKEYRVKNNLTQEKIAEKYDFVHERTRSNPNKEKGQKGSSKERLVMIV